MWINNVKQVYRLWSVRVIALIPIISVVTDYLPEMRAVLPEGWYAIVAVVAIVARAIKQGSDDNDNKPSNED